MAGGDPALATLGRAARPRGLSSQASFGPLRLNADGTAERDAATGGLRTAATSPADRLAQPGGRQACGLHRKCRRAGRAAGAWYVTDRRSSSAVRLRRWR